MIHKEKGCTSIVRNTNYTYRHTVHVKRTLPSVLRLRVSLSTRSISKGFGIVTSRLNSHWVADKEICVVHCARTCAYDKSASVIYSHSLILVSCTRIYPYCSNSIFTHWRGGRVEPTAPHRTGTCGRRRTRVKSGAILSPAPQNKRITLLANAPLLIHIAQ